MTAPSTVDPLQAALESASARFWAKVDRRSPAECWPWTAWRNSKGYGSFSFRGRTRRAHRVAYMLEYGPIPEGLVVRHQCDNPPCVNPAHLELGTVADNHRDMVERGRAVYVRGEAIGQAVLTEEMVVEARRRVHAGETVAAVARGMNVNRETLHYAVRGGWSHVHGEPPVPAMRQRLTAEQVAEARHRARAGESMKPLATEMGVSRTTLREAVRGLTWPGPVLGVHPVPAR